LAGTTCADAHFATIGAAFEILVVVLAGTIAGDLFFVGAVVTLFFTNFLIFSFSVPLVGHC